MRKYLTGIALLFCTVLTFAQSVAVSGTVSDISGETLIGVNVQVRGTTIGTVTDVDGKYALQAPNAQSRRKLRSDGRQLSMLL